MRVCRVPWESAVIPQRPSLPVLPVTACPPTSVDVRQDSAKTARIFAHHRLRAVTTRWTTGLPRLAQGGGDFLMGTGTRVSFLVALASAACTTIVRAQGPYCKPLDKTGHHILYTVQHEATSPSDSAYRA